MTVYLEYAFLDNFTMDCILLFCSAKTLKIRFSHWRIALGALVGTVFALVSVYFKGILLYLCKFACLVAMCAASIGFGKKLFWHILLTLAYTFVTGGAIVGVFNLLGVNYVTENGLCYNMPVPLFVYLAGVAIAAFLCYSVVTFVSQNKKIAPHLKKVVLQLDKAYRLLGFCDSGNSVCCNGLPVCFVTKSFGNVKKVFAQKILQGAAQKVTLNTLNGQSQVFAIPATLSVDGKQHQIYLALPQTKNKTQFDLLLSEKFCQ